MTVDVTVDVPATEFILSGLVSIPGITVQLEPAIQMGSTNLPDIRVSGVVNGELEECLQADSDTESFEIEPGSNGVSRVHVDGQWPSSGVIDPLSTTGGTVLRGSGGDGAWTLQLRFEDEDTLSSFYELCTGRQISLDLRSIDRAVPPDGLRGFELTAMQLETLQHAFEHGFFAVPREITLQEMAADFGISDSAVSQRIRRGLETVLTSAFPEA